MAKDNFKLRRRKRWEWPPFRGISSNWIIYPAKWFFLQFLFLLCISICISWKWVYDCIRSATAQQTTEQQWWRHKDKQWCQWWKVEHRGLTFLFQYSSMRITHIIHSIPGTADSTLPPVWKRSCVHWVFVFQWVYDMKDDEECIFGCVCDFFLCDMNFMCNTICRHMNLQSC